MTARRPSLTTRCVALLDRMAFAMDLLAALEPVPEGWDVATPKPLESSAHRLRDEARALVDEHRRRLDAGGVG